jgi:hypothetical protein
LRRVILTNCLKVNLEEKPELKKIFFDNNVERILTELSILHNENVVPGNPYYSLTRYRYARRHCNLSGISRKKFLSCM